ncbi:MAG: hypothetical protein PVTTEEND_001062 [Candidatus Fervidibacter sp.]|jgi:hypothetical protein
MVAKKVKGKRCRKASAEANRMVNRQASVSVSHAMGGFSDGVRSAHSQWNQSQRKRLPKAKVEVAQA